MSYEEALKTVGTNYERYVYEGADHAFHNCTAAAQYIEAAAKLAGEMTLAFFEKH